MKENLWRYIAVICGVAFLWSVGQGQGHQEAAGRYQIVTTPGNANESSWAFKIDTATGKTWVKTQDQQGKLAWAVLPDYATK
jgi:hypothetical protein